MLSFDEFQAINRRESNKKSLSSQSSTTPQLQEDQKKTLATSVGENKNQQQQPQQSKSLLTSLGQFLEMHEMQIVIILLIFLDSFASFLILILTSSSPSLPFPSSSSPSSIELYLHILRSFTTFTIFFFLFELTLLFCSFQFHLFGHVGYVIDLLILAYEVNETIQYNGGVNSRVLNLFRLWRIIRLFQSLVNQERDAHNETIRLLDAMQLKKQFFEEKIETLNDDLVKEQVRVLSHLSHRSHFTSHDSCVGVCRKLVQPSKRSFRITKRKWTH